MSSLETIFFANIYGRYGSLFRKKRLSERANATAKITGRERPIAREINRRSRCYGIELRPTLFIVGAASTRMCFNSDNGSASHRFYPMAGLPSLYSFVRPSIHNFDLRLSLFRAIRSPITGAFYRNATRPNDRSSEAREKRRCRCDDPKSRCLLIRRFSRKFDKFTLSAPLFFSVHSRERAGWGFQRLQKRRGTSSRIDAQHSSRSEQTFGAMERLDRT